MRSASTGLETGLSASGPHLTKPLTVTVTAARKISGLGNTTLWGLIKVKKLETVRVGRRTLITYRSLEALLMPRSGSERGRAT
jgi:hypothetical protein